MTAIGFIGLGNMGGPMAANLLKAGHAVTGFDISAMALEGFAAGGGKRGASFAEAAGGGDIVITMLPAGPHVRAVYLGEKGVLANARKGSLLIDCSTMMPDTPCSMRRCRAASPGPLRRPSLSWLAARRRISPVASRF